MQQGIDVPLSDAEFNQLADFLDGLGDEAMNLEMLDGFLAALICCPDLVPPNEYLPQILGANFSFEDEAHASAMLGLIMRHWNTIASKLLETLEHDDVYSVILREDENGVLHGNDWAQGFMSGVGLRPDSWQELFDNEEYSGSYLPIMMLIHEHDPDPKMRTPAITQEMRDELLDIMISGLTHIYRYFAPHRQSASASASASSVPFKPFAPATMRRQTAKLGRNEPCPCGSGRKYKQCCGKGA